MLHTRNTIGPQNQTSQLIRVIAANVHKVEKKKTCFVTGARHLGLSWSRAGVNVP